MELIFFKNIIVDRLDSKLPLALDSLMNYTSRLNEFENQTAVAFVS